MGINIEALIHTSELTIRNSQLLTITLVWLLWLLLSVVYLS